MAVRLLKCFGKKCEDNGIKHPREIMTQFPDAPKKNYCHECYQATIVERQQRKELESYIFHLFDGEIPGMVRAQIKKFEGDGYTLKNIRLALKYFVEIKGGEIAKNRGIGIMPYVHDEMIAYHKERIRKRNETELVDVGTTKIKMKYPTRKFDYKQEKMINLEELANAIGKQ